MVGRMITAEKLSNEVYTLKSSGDLDPLMQKIGGACYVLLGEASQATHEYYTNALHLNPDMTVVPETYQFGF